jgi:hypothetical protein
LAKVPEPGVSTPVRDHAHTLGFPRPLLPSRLYYQIYYGRDSEHRPLRRRGA